MEKEELIARYLECDNETQRKIRSMLEGGKPTYYLTIRIPIFINNIFALNEKRVEKIISIAINYVLDLFNLEGKEPYIELDKEEKITYNIEKTLYSYERMPVTEEVKLITDSYVKELESFKNGEYETLLNKVDNIRKVLRAKEQSELKKNKK